MRVLAPIVGLLIGSGIVAASADPVARSNTVNKSEAIKNELRSQSAVYQGFKPRLGSASDARAGDPNERESGRFAKSVITNAAKPLSPQPATQPSAQASARFANLKLTSIDRSGIKSHFAQAQEGLARSWGPMGPGSGATMTRSSLNKDGGTKEKKGVLLNKFPRN
jgi:hypothetical protein